MSGRDHWQGVHSQKDVDDVSWWQEPDDLWLDLIEDLDLPSATPIVDVGSGSSMLADALVGLGYTQITALDISSAALDRIRERLGEAVRYEAADVADFAPGSPVGLWHDRAVFHFLTSESARSGYGRSLHRALAADGHAIIATFAPDGPERCSGLPVQRYDADDLAAAVGLKLVQAQRRVHRTPWGAEQPFTVAVLSR
ncbi:MAG: class I SAM-dependent methyltransferase [Candidatus Nanopelagicales bacterium]|nr:class I SAM-dependent methyltransferase [Candidatus Nanopelagicales bacterium]